ncbi:MarR family winged helix-turn-helix transcriptional regulator [Streptomyces sp. NPDC001177]
MSTQREVAEQPPLAWNQGLTHLLWRAQSLAHRAVDEALDPLGVTVTQLSLAVLLDEHGPLSGADLARARHITPQSVITAMNRLQELGWVARRPHPVHKRVVLFELLAAGRDGMTQGRRVVEAVNDRIAAVLGADGPERCADDLRRIIEALAGPEQPVAALWPERSLG